MKSKIIEDTTMLVKAHFKVQNYKIAINLFIVFRGFERFKIFNYNRST